VWGVLQDRGDDVTEVFGRDGCVVAVSQQKPKHAAVTAEGPKREQTVGEERWPWMGDVDETPIQHEALRRRLVGICGMREG
jgi:hypothetical protein